MRTAFFSSLLLIAGCATQTIDLYPPLDASLPDAAISDAAPAPDLHNSCACRYTCRTNADCVGLGGMSSCDPQQQLCTGVGTCSTVADCVASTAGPLCAVTADSLQACP